VTPAFRSDLHFLGSIGLLFRKFRIGSKQKIARQFDSLRRIITGELRI
jgi:hypothetical protein